MKQRNPVAVALLPLVTLGIYGIYWAVKTKGEMNARGAQIPTAWWIIVPFVNIWWLWKYSEGVEKVTGGQLSTVISFILLLVLDIIGMAVVQNSFNKHTGGPTPAAAPTEAAPTPPQEVPGTTPVDSTPPPVANPTPPAPEEPTSSDSTPPTPPAN